MAAILALHARHAWRSLHMLLERHVVIAFFALTYAFSWSVWMVEPLVTHYDPRIGTRFALLAPYGPTLAALALAALLQPQRCTGDRSISRFVLTGITLAGAIVVSWSGLSEIVASPHPPVAAAIWLLAVLLPPWIVWNVRSSIRGVRAVLGSLAMWRVHIAWYGVALLIMPLAAGLGIGLLALLGQPLPAFPRVEPLPGLASLLLAVFLGTLLYGGPLGEEAGWRGFALPRLQSRFSPAVASLILGVTWGLWHLPLHLRGFYGGDVPGGMAGIGLRILSNVGLAILFTWLYNRTRGNLLLMVLLHTAANNTAGFWLPITIAMYAMMAMFVVVVISLDNMWLPLSPAATTVRTSVP